MGVIYTEGREGTHSITCQDGTVINMADTCAIVVQPTVQPVKKLPGVGASYDILVAALLSLIVYRIMLVLSKQ